MTWKWKITINWVTLLLTFIGCTFPIGIRAIMGKIFFIFHSTPISLWSSGTMRGDKYNQQLQWHRTRMDLPLRIITIITHMWVHNSLLNWQVRETYSCNDSLFTCCVHCGCCYTITYLSLYGLWKLCSSGRENQITVCLAKRCKVSIDFEIDLFHQINNWIPPPSPIHSIPSIDQQQIDRRLSWGLIIPFHALNGLQLHIWLWCGQEIVQYGHPHICKTHTSSTLSRGWCNIRLTEQWTISYWSK